MRLSLNPMAASAAAAALAAIAQATSATPPPLTWIGNDTSLPKVLILSTGGTILSASNYSRLDNIHYGLGVGPTPYDLIGNSSEVLSVARLAVIEFDTPPGGSASINSSLYLNVSQTANRYLCSSSNEGDEDIAGAIMFHGTNTLEETAFGVDITFNCSKPFVATGAMRPQSYLSPDGPSNFYQAVAAAASPESRDRGGMIVFNDRITSIFYATKTDANTPDTFKAIEQGNLGSFLAGMPFYYYGGGSLPNGRPYFDVEGLKADDLPAVQVFWLHQGFPEKLLFDAVENGAKGIVLMGSGAASISPAVEAAAETLYTEKGIPIVAVPRPVTGSGPPPIYPGPVFYGSYVGGEQARIMLQLALAKGHTLDEIRDLFEGPLRKAIYRSANLDFYY